MSNRPIASQSTGRMRLRNAVACFMLAAFCLVAGVLWLGLDGALSPASPDFMPLPLGFAAAIAAIGLVHLAQGGLDLWRHRSFGAATLDAGPAALGQRFSGRIRTAANVQATGPYEFTLTCSQSLINEDSDSRSRRTTEVLWMAEATQPAFMPSSQGIPFSFDIPANGLPTERPGQPDGETVVWWLGLTAPTKGLAFKADFLIDVAARGHAPSTSAQAFVGHVRPEQSVARVFRLIFTVLGPLLIAAGAYGTLGELMHTAAGHRQTGTILAYERPAMRVALDSGGWVGVSRVSRNTRWKEGQRVEMTCSGTPQVPNRCRVETNGDRWIDAVGSLVVGLVLGGVALFLHRRRGGRVKSAKRA